MRIVYLGNNDRGVTCLEALIAEGHEIAGVVAQSEPERKTWYASVAEAARKRGLPVIQPERIADELMTLRAWSPELMVLAGYARIVPPEVLSIPKMGAVNLHGGRLPDYRGASVMNWQIINGEHEMGLSVLRVDEGIDTGDLLAEERITLGPNDTIAYVLGRSLELFPQMLVRVLREMEAGTLKAKPQDPIEGCTWAKRRPRDGMLRWRELTAARAHNMIRALTRPYPGAFTKLAGRKIIIWKSRIPAFKHVGEPGRVVRHLRDETLIACRDIAVAVSDVTDLNGDPVKLPVGADLA